LVSRDLLSTHVFPLEIAVCGTEVYRKGIPEIAAQFLEFFLAEALITSCFPVVDRGLDPVIYPSWHLGNWDVHQTSRPYA